MNEWGKTLACQGAYTHSPALIGHKQGSSLKKIDVRGHPSECNSFKKFYLILAVLGVHCCAGFSLVMASRDYPLAAVRRVLIVVAFLVAEHGL